MKLQDRIKIYRELSSNYKEDFKLFQKHFFPLIMKWEGGSKLHNVSDDPGGWTRWGIAWNLWGWMFDSFKQFKNITEEEACLLAFGNFYIPIKAYLAPRDCKLYYMDMAYNMGAKQAIKIFQRCAGVRADGVFGVITERYANKVTEKCLKYRRERFYYRLAERKYKMRKFLRGWLNRSRAVFNYKY